MEELFGIAHGVLTGLLIVIFIGIVAWAWSRRRHRDFEEAKNLPFRDEEPPPGRPESPHSTREGKRR